MDAMANPHREGLDKHIELLEQAITFIKRHGFEYQLHQQLIDANKLLLQLKKRYKIYAEILALDQPTVAEIKSYSKPPPVVHTVMTGVFVTLGHKEKEMKVGRQQPVCFSGVLFQSVFLNDYNDFGVEYSERFTKFM